MSGDKGGMIEIDAGGNPLANMAALGGAIFGIGLAIAIWQAAFWLGLAAAAVGMGAGFGFACKGLAWIVWANYQGKAKIIEAEGNANAAIIRATAAQQIAEAHAKAVLRGARKGWTVEEVAYQLRDGRTISQS